MKRMNGFRFLYLNADQLLNKMEDLQAMIAEKALDMIIVTEVIPKAQKHPILEPLLKNLLTSNSQKVTLEHQAREE